MTFLSIPKKPLGPKVRSAVSKLVRDSAAGQPCALRLSCCLPGNETVVLAHLRMFGAAGIGQKPHDFHAVYACAACHDQLDRRSGDAEWGYDDILRALMETQSRLYAIGLLRLGPASKHNH